MSAALARLLGEPVDYRYKGFPTRPGVTIGTVADAGWNVLDRDLYFPLLVLRQSDLEHNLSTMARYCERHGVSLAPHGKTPMAPQLVARQLFHGAWGVTVATVSQARVYRRFGFDRLLMANELLGREELRWVVGELDTCPAFAFSCLVDSVEGVRIMDDTLESVSAGRRVDVLIELGHREGRTGARTDAKALEVVAAVRESRHLVLSGVECYEASLGTDRSAETLAAVDRFLDRARRFTLRLIADGAFDGCSEIVVTAGGSAYFDRVVERLRFARSDGPIRVVLRSGCYATHDHAQYERLSPLRNAGHPNDGLRPALELWGEVLSRPEDGLAIVGLGRRDAPFDADLPIPIAIVKRSGERVPADGRLTVFKLNDQHAFVRITGIEVAVGDLLVCGISHPCTAFDKWPLIALVDDRYRVTGAVATLF